MPRILSKATTVAMATALGCAVASSALFASSHREAPAISALPKVDGTDFYMFRSYETGRDGFVTLIANYQPLQDSYGGPNYFTMDPNALYEIHIDNNGDSREDITFQFRFQNTYLGATIDVDGTDVAVPLVNIGPNTSTATVGTGVDQNAGLNVIENYEVTVVRGDRRSRTTPPNATNLTTTGGGDNTLFRKPVDNIGTKTIPDYDTYAQNHVFSIDIPGCGTDGVADGRVFVGQRREGFVVNLGEIFDRINLDPQGARDANENIVNDKNITSIALELSTECLQETVTGDNTPEPVIGGWTTASLRQARVLNPLPLAPGGINTDDNGDADGTVTAQDGDTNTPAVHGGAWTQVSRVSNPLINELVIGLNRKDLFNAAEPFNDLAQFGNFVLTPSLPAIIEALFSVPAPATPRNDLVAAFVTGIRTNVNGEDTNFTQPQFITDINVDGDDDNDTVDPAELRTGGEMLRLNTAFPADPPPAMDAQNDLGFLACDLYGFPNGRRPIDDVVDIELTVAEGALTATNPNGLQTCDVSGATPTVVNPGGIITDGALPSTNLYQANFPYLGTPLPGSPIESSEPVQ